MFSYKTPLSHLTIHFRVLPSIFLSSDSRISWTDRAGRSYEWPLGLYKMGYLL